VFPKTCTNQHWLCKLCKPSPLVMSLLILQAPELELKPLPDNLKYVFIGDNNTLPVITTKGLTSAQEEKLLKLLCDHKTTIGWTLPNIKGISPSMCIHHILLEDKCETNEGNAKEVEFVYDGGTES